MDGKSVILSEEEDKRIAAAVFSEYSRRTAHVVTWKCACGRRNEHVRELWEAPGCERCGQIVQWDEMEVPSG